jgi:hypothetical protein
MTDHPAGSAGAKRPVPIKELRATNLPRAPAACAGNSLDAAEERENVTGTMGYAGQQLSAHVSIKV